MRFRVWLMMTAALALGGCELDPAYAPPKVAMPAHFDDADKKAARAVQPQWWHEFRDATLDRLEQQVDAANPDLKAALANAEFALARAEAATSGLYPELDAGASITANKQSDDRPLRSADQPTYYGNNQLYATVASYEIDIWGRVADIVKAANADAQASADAYGLAQLELHAALARAYVDLRGLDAESRLVSDTITNYRSSLDLTHSRVAANISPPMDEERAKTQLATAEAEAADLSRRRATLVDAIATLAGAAAPGFSIKPSLAAMSFPQRPRTAPGDVLLRRPDVAQAEREAASASALIGAARAAFLPKFTIGLIGGTQDTGFNLLSLTNSAYTVGPAVSAPIFDFGLRAAQLKEAQARFKGASENYRASVLNALKDVQNSLSDLRWLAEQERQTQLAAEAARKTSDMSMALYRDGAASYLDVFTAQNAALDEERSAIALRSLQLRANISLMLALGGGWTPEAVEKPEMAALASDP
jgi:outer membrane protein, multidrug efflux system